MSATAIPARLLAAVAATALAATAAAMATDGAGGDQGGPAFDCARARTPDEREICASPRLSLLDRILGRYHAQAIAVLEPGQRTCLRQSQRRWLGAERGACGADPECLERTYLVRLRELEGLLPGLALERRLDDLPAVPAAPLLAILAPTAPTAQAGGPDATPLQPVVVEGVPVEDEGGYLLVDQGFDRAAWEAYAGLLGDEEALRARFGDDPVAALPGIVGAFGGDRLDPGARAAVDAAAAQGRRLRATGRAAAGDGPPQLSAAACTFLQRLDPP